MAASQIRRNGTPRHRDHIQIMTYSEKDERVAPVSRRDLLTRAAVFTATIAAGLGGSLKSAVAKMTQKAALYQAKPKEGARCATCEHFQPPASCQIVAGKVSPNGWCQMYIKK